MTDDEIEVDPLLHSGCTAYADLGVDFVDIKHCHGYLLHDFRRAHPAGRYGSFENRTRILREIIDGIRADGNGIDIVMRLSAFDSSFQTGPENSQH